MMRLVDDKDMHGRHDFGRRRGMLVALSLSVALWVGMFGMVRTLIG